MGERDRVLVTGGFGFIGANLIRLLLSRGYPVTVLDDLSAGREEHLEGLDIRWVRGSILDRELVDSVVPGHPLLVHLAAQTGVPLSVENPLDDFEVNARGTLLLLEAARKAGTRRFLFASSNAPLGRQQQPATEDKAPLPVSPYGASKLAGEAYCLAYHGSWGLQTVVLRFGNVYGPHSGQKSSVVAKFFTDILSGSQVTIYDTGDQTRDFIYVEDLCHAILRGLESDVGGEVFQIASGEETTIKELAKLVQETVSADTGRDFRIDHAPPRRGDVARNFSNVDKARDVLEWTPVTALPVGLKKTWAWFGERQRSDNVGKDTAPSQVRS